MAKVMRELLSEFGEADKEWSRLLKLQFGKHAGDIRYQPEGMGEPGSELRIAHDRFMKTGKAWRQSLNME